MYNNEQNKLAKKEMSNKQFKKDYEKQKHVPKKLHLQG